MIRAFQWDLARQTERLGWMLAQLPRYADWGYTELYLHLEDAVEYPSLPGVARRGAYSCGQMEKLVAAAGKAGIGVVPIVNLLGHTQYLIKVPALQELNERVDAAGRPLETGQICPLHPRTLEVAERLLRDMAPFCTAGKVHVGLDESFALGLHPRSRAEIRRIGLAAHFGRYVQRLQGVVERVGQGRLQMGMWADMLALLPAAIDLLPRGIAAYDWYYPPFRRRPAVELYNFREYELAPRLRRRGIDYWGCPMSGGYRFEPLPTFADRLDNARAWWERCRRVRAAGMLVTAWESSRLAAPVVQAVDAAVAGLWLEEGERRGNDGLLAAGFQRAFRVTAAMARTMVRAARVCDQRAYAGYYRWELDEDWRFAARGEVGRRQGEARAFRAWVERLAAAPPPFVASLRYRSFLAERDAELAWAFSAPGRMTGPLDWEGAQAAARIMWRCSRRGVGVLELRLRKDRKKWSDAGWAPEDAYFRCIVHNFAPALQKVVIEAQDGAGDWRVLRGRFTIEFTRRGAVRRAVGLDRPLAVRLPQPLPRRLRLAVRGVGEVRVSGCELLRGGRRYPLGPRKAIRLGKEAPRQGFPPLDFTRHQGAALTLPLDPPADPVRLPATES